MSEPAELEFLAGDWFAALGEAITASLPEDFGTSIALGQVVTDVEGAENGEVRYSLLLGPGPKVRVVIGSTEDAEVVLSAGYAAARALARGDTSAASLLEEGRVKISGDARRLVAAVDLLGVVGESLTDLRGRTTYR
jgi:hypothetical protein